MTDFTRRKAVAEAMTILQVSRQTFGCLDAQNEYAVKKLSSAYDYLNRQMWRLDGVRSVSMCDLH